MMETSSVRQQYIVLPNVAPNNNQLIFLQQPIASTGTIPVLLTNATNNLPVNVVGTSASVTPTNSTSTKRSSERIMLQLPISYIPGKPFHSDIQSPVVLEAVNKTPLPCATQSKSSVSSVQQGYVAFGTLPKSSIASSVAQGTLNNVPASGGSDKQNYVVPDTLNKVTASTATGTSADQGTLNSHVSSSAAIRATQGSVAVGTLNKTLTSSASQMGTTVSKTTSSAQGQTITVQPGGPGGMSVVTSQENLNSCETIMTMPRKSTLTIVPTSTGYTKVVSGLAYVANSRVNNTTAPVSQEPVMSQTEKVTQITRNSSSGDIVQSETRMTVNQQSKTLSSGFSITTAVVTSAGPSYIHERVPLGPPVVTSRVVSTPKSTQISTSDSQDAACQTGPTAGSATTSSGKGSFLEIKNFPKKSGTMKYRYVSVNLNGVVQKLLVPTDEELVASGKRDTSVVSSSSSSGPISTVNSSNYISGSISATKSTAPCTSSTSATTNVRSRLTSTPAVSAGVLTTTRQSLQNGLNTSVVMPPSNGASKSQRLGDGPSIVLQQNGAPGNIIRGTLLGVSTVNPNNKTGPREQHPSSFVVHTTPSQGGPSCPGEDSSHATAEKPTSGVSPSGSEERCGLSDVKIQSVFSLSEKVPQSTGSPASSSDYISQSESLVNVLKNNNLLNATEESPLDIAGLKDKTSDLVQNMKTSASIKCPICLLHQSNITGQGQLCDKYDVRPIHITLRKLHTVKRSKLRKQDTGKVLSNINVKKRKTEEKDKSASGDEEAGLSSFLKQEWDSLSKNSPSSENVCDGESKSMNSPKDELNISKPNFSKYFLVKSQTGCFLVPRCNEERYGVSSTKTVYKVVQHNTGKAVMMRSGAGAKKVFVELLDASEEDPGIKDMVQADHGPTSSPKPSTPLHDKCTTARSETEKMVLSQTDRIKALKEKMKAQEEELERLRKEREQSVNIFDILEDI